MTDPFAPPPLERGANPDQWSYFPPPGEYPAPWQPAPRTPLLQRLLPPLKTFAVTTAVMVLLGAPFALLWRAVARPAVVVRTAQGPSPAAPESNQVFAVDGRFVLLSLVTGAVLGALAWFFLRTRGPAGPAGLAAGGVLAMLVTAAVGRRLVIDRYVYDYCHGLDPPCLVYDGTLHLHAMAAVVVLPVAMLASFVAMTFLFEPD